MAGNESFLYHLCLKWMVKLPIPNDNIKCSKFCIRQDSRWFLELKYLESSTYPWYSLNLCNEVAKDLEEPIVVTAYLQVDNTPILPKVTTVRRAGTQVWSEYEMTIFQEMSGYKFSINCVFHDSTDRGDEFICGKTQVSTENDTVSTDLQSLSCDWSTFLVDQTFSDIKLKCGDRTFSAHKTVLAARSEVFSAIFRSNMAEREAGVVEIEDLDPEILEPFLVYMYSGEKPDLSPCMAQRLYEAADKYAVYALKRTCSEFMVAGMTLEDCMDLLVLADKHSDEDFKEKASSFVAEHLHFLSKESWSEFKKGHPNLAVQVYDKAQVSTQTDVTSTDIYHLQNLSRDLNRSVVDSTFSDIKLKCGDRTFAAHKTVLAARSEVFSAMFRSNMAESETGIIDVEDFDPYVLESFLRYIYSGNEPNINSGMARRLYEVVDKYGVHDLRKTCSEYMIAGLTKEDCLDLLVLGDKHFDDDFKEKASSFVAEHLHLLSKESWSEFKEEHPDLAVKVYDKRLADVLSRQK